MLEADALYKDLSDLAYQVFRPSEPATIVSVHGTTYECRGLSESETDLMTSLGNLGLEKVRIAVTSEQLDSASEVLRSVRNCRFRGRCVLLLVPQPSCGRVEDCTFEDVVVDLSATVIRCDTVRLTVIDSAASITNCAQVGPEEGKEAEFPKRLNVETGPEVGSGRFNAELGLHMSYEDALRAIMARKVHADESLEEEANGCEYHKDYGYLSYIGPASRISSSVIRACRTLGRVRIVNSDLDTVLCDYDTEVKSYSTLRRVFLQSGSSIGGRGASSVEDAFLCRKASADNGARVTNCLLGPEAHLEAIEATCCLVGPSIGMHHNALLIACLWPEGRGNVACGALVGSNHTGRAPDTMIWAGEGVFVGLGAQVKYPQTLVEAPYSLIAAGVLVPAQRLKMPFSLVVMSASDPSTYRRVPGMDNTAAKPIPPGTPRLLPGWVLRYSMYTIVRNESKFRSRTKVLPRTGVIHGVVRDATVRLCMGARQCILRDLQRCTKALEASVGHTEQAALAEFALTAEEMPNLGACWVTWRDCLKAVDDYGDIIILHALRCLLEFVEHTNGIGDGQPVVGHGYFDAYLDKVCDHEMLPGPAIDAAHPSGWRVWLLLQEFGFDVLSPQAEWKDRAISKLRTLPEREEKMFESAFQSKMRDKARSAPITPLYEEAAVPLDAENLDSALDSASRRMETMSVRVDAAISSLGGSS